ncbi:MAG: hypothetical protein F6J93_25345 [Oscillatoria sp. SIO1A7]|nr:hypothetical protein [Oscillatoria sp. SIO1A7]
MGCGVWGVGCLGREESVGREGSIGNERGFSESLPHLPHLPHLPQSPLSPLSPLSHPTPYTLHPTP